MKKIILFFASILVFLHVYGQNKIVIDTFQQKIIVECSLFQQNNDSLFNLVDNYHYDKVCIYSDSSNVTVNLAYFYSIKEITFIGNGSYEINYKKINNDTLNINVIEIYSTIKKINFGKGINSLHKFVANQSGLKSIPRTLQNCSNLTIIDLSWNEISKTGNRLKDLDKLEYLGITNNKLKKVSSNIKQNTSLIEVNFQQNNINKVNKSIILLQNLKAVNLMGNVLKEYPSFFYQRKDVEFYVF